MPRRPRSASVVADKRPPQRSYGDFAFQVAPIVPSPHGRSNGLYRHPEGVGAVGRGEGRRDGHV